MTASIHTLPTFAQQRHAESERNALLERDNASLEWRLIKLKAANADLARQAIIAEQWTERVERRLRSRLIELTWPATLGAIVGGFLAVVLIWLGGF